MDRQTEGSGSWWTTLPGVLTALAAIITALSGLVAILVQNGVLGQKSKEAMTHPVAAISSTIAPASAAEAAPVPVTASATDAPTATAKDPDSTRATTAQTASPAQSEAAPAAVSGVVTGVTDQSLPRKPFTGAIVTTSDGGVVKLRDDIREYCQSGPTLKTTQGQSINMDLIRRFDVVTWQSQKGTLKIALTNGEAFTTAIEACSMRGTNDLGEASIDFDRIRSVEFVR